MCFLSSSRLCVYRAAFQSIRIAQWHRSSIHFWHYLRQRRPLGATKILEYESLAVPNIRSQSIRLWKNGKCLGLLPLKDVLRRHLRPGYMLWLRGEPPSKTSTAPPPEGYDYEVRPLELERPKTTKRSALKGLRAREYYLNVNQSSEHLRVILLEAYRFLHQGGNKVHTPVEFHVKAQGPLSHADLSLFTMGRADLHPKVILRALPKGVFQALEPQGDILEGDALWIVATDDLKASPFAMPQTPSAKAGKVRKMVQLKRAQVKEAIEAGRITAKGVMTPKWRDERANEFVQGKNARRRAHGTPSRSTWDPESESWRRPPKDDNEN